MDSPKKVWPSEGLGASVKFNPHLWGADELRAIFVVRQEELRRLLNALTATTPASIPQHVLITGQRGMGKSTLLQRLALAIADDRRLRKQWLPLTFPEEQYTVSTLSEFLRNVLDALADALEREGASNDELASLDREIKRIGDLPPEQCEQYICSVLASWVQDHGRGLVLLIDSTDQLFSALSAAERGAKSKGSKSRNSRRVPKDSSTALWRLRKLLSHQPGIFWIGASYQALEATQFYHDAFHDFFDLLELGPLTIEEMRSAMFALARVFGVGRGLSGDDAVAEIRRTLDEHPERLQALRALTGGNPRTTVMLYELLSAAADDTVHGDIKRLLDLMTPLYKSRLESLAEQPRKILAHMLEHWTPMSAGELAQVSGIPNTTVSGQLARLESEGLIEKTKLSGTTRSGYQVGERFFSVWYLMRYAARRLRQRLIWLIEFMRLWYSHDELAQLAAVRAGRHAQGLLGDMPSLEYSRAMASALSERESEKLRLEWAVHSAAYRESRCRQMTIEEAMPGLYDGDGDDKTFASAEGYRARLDALDSKLALCSKAGHGKQAFIRAIKSSLWLPLQQKELIANNAAAMSRKEVKALTMDFNQERSTLVSQIGAASTDRILEAVRTGEFFPDFPDPRLVLSQLLSCLGHDEPALRILLPRYVAAHPRDDSEQVCRCCATNIARAAPSCCLGRILALQDEDNMNAEEAYRKATEIAPDWASPWNGLAETLQSLGRNDEAEAAFRKAIDLDKKWATPWNGLGDLMHDTERYGEAEAAYRNAADLNPKWAIPWSAVGELLFYHLERHSEAEAAYRKAIELDSNSAATQNDLAALLRYSKRYEEAEEVCRKAIELSSKWATPWENLAHVLYDLNRFDEAEAACQKAIELSPTWARPWNGLGHILAALNRNDDAVAAYQKAIELDPKSAAVSWHDLSVLLHHMEKYDEAEFACRRATEINPNWATPWKSLGELLNFHLERNEEAEAAYRKAIELDPKEPSAWSQLGVVLRMLKRYEEAETACRKAIELKSTSGTAWNNLGILLHIGKRYDEAEFAYRKAIEFNPERSLPWLRLGDLLRIVKRPSDAEAAYRRAVELDEDWALPWIRLGDLLRYLKRYGEAEIAFRKALSIGSPSLRVLLNLAYLAAIALRREDASSLYRQAIDVYHELDASEQHPGSLLQAHLWLGNRDLAARELEDLAYPASEGESSAFAKLRQQIRQCIRLGMSRLLAELMEQSEVASFLQPLSLALRAVEAGGEIPPGAAPEVLDLAAEVRRELVEKD